MTLLGLKPATFRLVTQRLDHLRYSVAPNGNKTYYYKSVCSVYIC
jgi:hypothetical protein